MIQKDTTTKRKKKAHVCVVERVKQAIFITSVVSSTEVTVEFQVANAKVPRS